MAMTNREFRQRHTLHTFDQLMGLKFQYIELVWESWFWVQPAIAMELRCAKSILARCASVRPLAIPPPTRIRPRPIFWPPPQFHHLRPA